VGIRTNLRRLPRTAGGRRRRARRGKIGFALYWAVGGWSAV